MLLDFGDVIVHVQHAEEREYYALERLWKDCPQLPFVDADAAQAPVLGGRRHRASEPAAAAASPRPHRAQRGRAASRARSTCRSMTSAAPRRPGSPR